MDEALAIDKAFASVDVLVTAGCFLALVAEIDWLTTYEVSMDPLYLLLVMLVTWRCGWKWGLAFALASLVNQMAIGFVIGHPFSKLVYFVVANLEKLFASLIVIALLTRLRMMLEREKQLRDRQTADADVYGAEAQP